MTGRSTSWFDRGELKALFKGVRPPRPAVPETELPEAEPPLESPPVREPELSPPTEPPAASPSDDYPGLDEAPREAERIEARAHVGEWAMEPASALERESSPTTTEVQTPVALEPVPEATPAPMPTPEADVRPPGDDTPGPEGLAAADTAPPAPAPVAAPPPLPAPVAAPLPVATLAPPAPDPISEELWRQSEALLHLARGQAATQALEERLWEITETAAAVLSLARASVWTFDDERTRLTCSDFYSAARDAHESGQAQSARDYPLYFAALHSERSIVAHDAKADPRTRELAAASAPVTEARIEAPVFVAGRLAGVVRLEHEGSPRRFEHHEERFAASLADLCGLALEAQERRLKEAVAKVGEERVRAQRDALAELSRSESLARGRVDGLLHEVTETAVRVLRAERCSVWVWAPDYKSLFCLDAYERAAARHHRGAEMTEERAPRYFEALRSGGRLATPDARQDPRLAELLRDGLVPPGISARLEAPIHLVGLLAGVLWCERAGSPRSWLADEERFVEALAGFVALSIATSERRRTENELRRALRDLDRTEPRSPAEKGDAERSREASVPDAFDEDLGDA
jgi:GAF domain-containing protein